MNRSIYLLFFSALQPNRLASCRECLLLHNGGYFPQIIGTQRSFSIFVMCSRLSKAFTSAPRSFALLSRDADIYIPFFHAPLATHLHINGRALGNKFFNGSSSYLNWTFLFTLSLNWLSLRLSPRAPTYLPNERRLYNQIWWIY